MRAAAGDVAGILCLFSVAAALDFKYHHAEELEAYLKEVHAAYPSFTHLHSIGRSVEVSGVLARYKNRMRRLYIAQCTLSYVTGSLPLYHEGHGLHLWEIVTLQSLFPADLMIHKDLGNNTFYGTAYSSTYTLSCRDLWVLVLGRFPTHHKIGIPEFKYVANMHGDETVGREILLHLIDFLVTSYRRDPVITRLLNNTRIHIMPTMNPDGFEATKVPDCYYTPGRYNKNGEDLNRNFPDAFESNNASIQPETQAVMDWIKNETFVLSANLHGGALVASYTFDNGNSVTGSLKGYSRSPDDDVFIHLAKTYSFNHASMYKGIGCDNRQTFPEGITNGYSWYQLEGGMQDYNYIWGQCFEITLELSCCKYPPANQLEKFWRDNKAALIEYMKQVHLGVKGQVTGKNGTPIPNAIVEAKGRAHVCPYRTNQQGEYFLLLLPGTYVINATVPGFKSMLKTVEIPDNTGNFSALKQDFFFSEVSIKPEVPSCPKIPLYQELDRASAAVKPTLHILGLMTVMLVIFK